MRGRERKGERKGFYVTALWMHAIHPRTLATNLAGFARFGCLKDLPEILYRFLHDPRDERKDQDDIAAAAPGARAGSGKRRLRPPRPGARRRRSTRRPCSHATTLTRPYAISTMASPTSSSGCSSRAWSTCARATRPRSCSPPSALVVCMGLHCSMGAAG
ncbi:unnamed protein product [Triticum turgidum subsp. durum]|uniref:DUF2828 domain-containing protein n=1 Tax=Triticum turgidum subsp. durum TaxID=4567 RepID=A0A9R0T307_TRITD|nr:unnamed protein product [Triticum turgidum subsp. durum]